jgi:hypothetical protein
VNELLACRPILDEIPFRGAFVAQAGDINAGHEANPGSNNCGSGKDAPWISLHRLAPGVRALAASKGRGRLRNGSLIGADPFFIATNVYASRAAIQFWRSPRSWQIAMEAN